MPRRSAPPLPALLLPLVALAGACADPTAASTARTPGQLALATSALPGGQYLVAVAPGARLDAAAVRASGGRVVASTPALGVHVVADVADPTPLTRMAGVRFVERDVAVTLDAEQLPVDPAPAPGAGAAAQTAAPTSATWYVSGLQWDLKAMKADQTLAQGAKGAGVNVCIIDSGVDDGHQELAGKVVRDTSFVAAGPSVQDDYGHGTHVAGSVAARGLVMSGVAPEANLFSARVFDGTGSSSSIQPFLAAIVWCADKGAHVVNMSLGGTRLLAGRPASSNPDVQAYTAAMKYANDRGTVVVVSAGNANTRLPNPAQVTVPAQVPGTIVVGASAPTSRNVPVRRPNGLLATVPRDLVPNWNPFDPAQVVAGPDTKTYYSNYGTAVDVFAPGGRQGLSTGFTLRITTETVLDSVTRQPVVPARTARVQHGTAYDAIWSACSRYGTFAGALDASGAPGGSVACRNRADAVRRYAALQGTSMAAPHVAGLAAIMYEALGGARTVANRLKVEQCIRSGTDVVGPSSTYGNGRVNAVKALACVKA